jgi:hypothetical protein
MCGDDMTTVGRRVLYAWPMLLTAIPAPLVTTARAAVESGRAARKWITER